VDTGGSGVRGWPAPRWSPFGSGPGSGAHRRGHRSWSEL